VFFLIKCSGTEQMLPESMYSTIKGPYSVSCSCLPLGHAVDAFQDTEHVPCKCIWNGMPCCAWKCCEGPLTGQHEIMYLEA
jgi:hypothetical protein